MGSKNADKITIRPFAVLRKFAFVHWNLVMEGIDMAVPTPKGAFTANFRATMARLDSIVARLSYKDWVFVLAEKHNVPYLRVEFCATSVRTGDVERQVGRPWMLSADMTDSEVVRTAMLAVLTAEEHEARELFGYRGHAIFSPHGEIDTGPTPENPILDLM